MVSGRPWLRTERDRSIFSLDYLAAAFFLLQTIGAFGIIDRLLYGEWDTKAGDKFTALLNLLVIATSGMLFWRGFRRNRRLLTGAILIFSIVGFLILSTSWSVDPLTTLRRAVLYLFFAMGIIGIANCLQGDEFVQLLLRVCFLSALATILLYLVSPRLAWMADGAGLRGVFTHKNVLGQVMAAGTLTCLHMLRSRSGRTLSYGLMLIVFLAVAFAARSATSLITIFSFYGMNAAFVLFRRGGVARIASIILVALTVSMAGIVLFFPDSSLEIIGKDPTLTGRTELWEMVESYIGMRPVFGWGLNAFWSPVNPLANHISASLGWIVPEAHNGLLEMLLEIGIVGTALFSFVWIRNVIFALRCLRSRDQDLAVSLLMCYGGLILVGMTEEVLIDFSQISVGMFFMFGLMCERAAASLRDPRFAGVPKARKTTNRQPVLTAQRGKY